MNFNELKAARIKRGVASKEMAQKLNLTPAQYSYKESGARRMFLNDAKKIADALNLTPAEILLIFFDIDINLNNKYMN